MISGMNFICQSVKFHSMPSTLGPGDIYPATLYDEPVIVHTVDLGYAEFLFVMVENNLGQKEHLYSNL